MLILIDAYNTSVNKKRTTSTNYKIKTTSLEKAQAAGIAMK
jgi:hypothetical protein